MEEKPALYGCESAEDIFRFIFGYETAIYNYDIKDEDSEHFQGFQDFINTHIQFENITSYENWVKLITLNSTSNSESLSNFFNYFNEFKNISNYISKNEIK